MSGRRKFGTLRTAMTRDQQTAAAQKAAAMADDATDCSLDAAQSAALAEALTEPAKANDALRALMRSKAPWK